jgi:hypothetical protein
VLGVAELIKKNLLEEPILKKNQNRVLKRNQSSLIKKILEDAERKSKRENLFKNNEILTGFSHNRGVIYPVGVYNYLPTTIT